jgi:hypothetical protein
MAVQALSRESLGRSQWLVAGGWELRVKVLAHPLVATPDWNQEAPKPRPVAHLLGFPSSQPLLLLTLSVHTFHESYLTTQLRL